MANKKSHSVEDDVDDVYVDDLYSIQDISKVLEYAVLQELRNIGFKEDVSVSYIRIFFYTILCSIGCYCVAFTHVETSKNMLKFSTAAYLLIWLILFLYERCMLHGANFRFYINDKLVHIWCRANAKGGNYQLYYTLKEFYEIPLGDVFFDDGKLHRDGLIKHLKSFSKIVMDMD
ncbi:hypothetical protein BdWA1_002464 [Babesia duncani]|uniref:Signal peptidase complex subunit 2 n=1 Tax=Babesia duncani TaxID=323732 RepID=A0AAD9UNJ2_9APIC|nr:hypothetical protein BdWA1_002464 [Babesia duncani]